MFSKPFAAPLIWAGAAVVVLSGCNVTETLNEKSKIDYRSASKGPALDVPPDLVSPRSDDRYKLPGSGDRTLSGFQRGQGAQQAATAAGVPVVPTVEGVRLERSGTQRWLVVNRPPEAVWPVIKTFWTDAGFVPVIESPENGLYETDWAENRARIPQDFIRRSIGKVFDSVYDSGTRDKFRTRLERVPGGTEVYVTHRGMEEVFDTKTKEKTVWVPRAPDPELEAEFLRRLMSRLGAPADTVAAAVPAQAAGAAAPAKAERAVIQGQGVDQRLLISEGFDQSWRQISLALDRGGFTVEDRDRSKGQFFVRYVDPETQAKLAEKPGFFSKLFGGGTKLDQTERFMLSVARSGEQATTVQVLDAKGAAVPPADRPTAGKILNLLRTQLN